MIDNKFEFEQFETMDQLKEYLCERDHKDSIVFENPNYLDAIIGIDEGGAVIYDYDLMAESLVEHEDMTLDDAYDFLDFNMVRTLPYINNGVRPIVNYRVRF